MRSKLPLLTLTTDFGLADEYVGVMKGVILGIAPAVPVIDLCHHIAPQDIHQAARLLAASFRYFPADSLHVVVVDPGVGSDRRIVLLNAHSQFFLAPDNGVLSAILQDTEESAKAWQVRTQDLFLAEVSQTFHGRDIFAPVAAHLAAGQEPAKVGPAINPHDLITIELPGATIGPNARTITGQVTGCDRFGNLLTNIHRSDITRFLDQAKTTELCFSIAGHTIHGLAETYHNVTPGSLLAIVGSRGFVEIAASQAHAADFLHPAANQPVIVTIPDS